MAQQQPPQSNFTSAELQLLTEGNSFEIDNVTFSHHTASVNGIQLHYVMGGKGDPVVLLHGWPETWYEWRHVMLALAKNYTVIAPDLRGIGDSSKPPTGYDGKTVAEDIHQLVTKLGFNSIYLVGHDIGVFAAYPYAERIPRKLRGWQSGKLGFQGSSLLGDRHYGGYHSIKHLTYRKPLYKDKSENTYHGSIIALRIILLH